MNSQQQKARIRELEEFARRVVHYGGNLGDDYLADQARAALADVEYGRPLACPPIRPSEDVAVVRVGPSPWGLFVAALGFVVGVTLYIWGIRI